MKPLVYLAHPVSGDPVGNAHKASAWIRWLTINDPARLYIASWVAEVLGFGESKLLGRNFYQHVLDDDAKVVARCDGLLAVGGEWTPGMLQERAVATILNKPVMDYTRISHPNEVTSQDAESFRWAALGAFGGDGVVPALTSEYLQSKRIRG